MGEAKEESLEENIVLEVEDTAVIDEVAAETEKVEEPTPEPETSVEPKKQLLPKPSPRKTLFPKKDTQAPKQRNVPRFS